MLAAPLLLVAACSGVTRSDSTNTAPPSQGNASADRQNLNAPVKVDGPFVAANTTFGFKLYEQVLKESQGKNLFISPASISFALGMAYGGADGETRQAFERALQARGMTPEDFARANGQLKAALEKADPKVQLQIANSLWSRQGLQFSPAFTRRIQDAYSAEVRELNFDDPSSVSIINQWVGEKTNGKIDKIVDQIDRDTLLFLINAIYFKGKWTAEFDKAKTKDDTFTTYAGQQRKHPMMSQSGNYQYLESPDFQAISLPYGDRRLSMYVFLPRNIDEFHHNLSAKNWTEWMGQFARTPGDIILPRFKVEYSISLNTALKALGLEPAFDPDRANFAAMFQTRENAYISGVKHKTYVDVNEEGTEAAAVTGIEMRTTSMRQQPERFRMVVDRPFFCAIRDNETGAVLFMGSILDPAQNQ